MTTLNVLQARSHFPALNSGYIYADNAGGSQATKGVIDRISDYLLNTNAQLGADYSVSAISTNRVLSEGPNEAAKLFQAQSPDEIVFGSSSTLNLENLSRGLENDIQPGDEFIVTGEHEGMWRPYSIEFQTTLSAHNPILIPFFFSSLIANVGPWKSLAARRGAIVKLWKATPTDPENPYSIKLKVEELIPLISSKTRLVAFTACSNILGSIVPVKEVVRAVREEAKAKGAKKVEISIDCVAYAPHRLIEVQDWDIDFCVFSFYKVRT